MKGKSLFIPTMYLLMIFGLTISLYLAKEAYVDYENKSENGKITYVSSGIFNRSIPVVNIEENISAPFSNQEVTIARYFYNSDDPIEQQKKSIVFYDNVYMPNTGIDYNYEEQFDVLSIYSGTVIDVIENELMGKTVEIRHNNELISVYQGLDNIEVQKGDIVGFGSKIGTSGTSVINKDLGQHVHLEIYKNGEVINPINCIGKKIGDI